MTRIMPVLISAVLVWSWHAFAGAATGDCTFDPNAVTESYFYAHTKFDKADWDDANKTATIRLPDDEFVEVKYFSCRHFGQQATYRFGGDSTGALERTVREKIKWLGDHVLAANDCRLLLKALDDNASLSLIPEGPDKDAMVVIQGSGYDEFVLVVSREDTGKLLIRLSWHMS